MHKKDRYIVYKGQKFYVDEETYRGYYKMRMKEYREYKKQDSEPTALSLELLKEKDSEIKDENSSSSPLYSLIQKETNQELHRALKSLDSAERKLITQVFFDGRSIYDIAKEIGISQTTLNYRKNAILKKNKEILQKSC